LESIVKRFTNAAERTTSTIDAYAPSRHFVKSALADTLPNLEFVQNGNESEIIEKMSADPLGLCRQASALLDCCVVLMRRETGEPDYLEVATGLLGPNSAMANRVIRLAECR